jgi:phage-related minor tail protein
VLKSLALRLSSMSLNLAMKPLTAQLAGGIDKLFGGIAGAFAGGGSIVPNAKGGVIAAPTYFPLGGGRTGLAGEAGPEAIMPLTRGADGRLGVAASGGGVASITVNIATPDAESFRRSETYLTGVVARAVARGQRGL